MKWDWREHPKADKRNRHHCQHSAPRMRFRHESSELLVSLHQRVDRFDLVLTSLAAGQPNSAVSRALGTHPAKTMLATSDSFILRMTKALYISSVRICRCNSFGNIV